MEKLKSVVLGVKDFLVGFLTVVNESKKAKALVVGLVVLVASKLGADVSDKTVYSVLAFLSVYILGQGLADMNKEAAKVEAKTVEASLELARKIGLEDDEDALN
jgi:hypothetical protein